MEEFLFELSVALVGTVTAVTIGIIALIRSGVKKALNNKKFTGFIKEQDLLAILFETAIQEVGRKHPHLSPSNYEAMLKVFLHKEVHKYFGYSLNDRQLEQLFKAARDSLGERLKG